MSLFWANIQQGGAVASFPTSGLTSYYRFDEEGGTIAYDSKGTHNGTASNAALLGSAGFHNNGIDFSAGNYNVNFGNSNDFNIETGAYSWSFWMYGRPTNDASRTLIAKSNGGAASASYGYQITSFHGGL